jgi:hypothetical protein
MKRTKSANELNIDKKTKKKKKEKSSSTLDGLVLASNTSPTFDRINKSYSDVDYFPMLPGALSPSINPDITSTNRGKNSCFVFYLNAFLFYLKDSLSDCYLNPSETMKTVNEIKYVQTNVTKPRVFQISVIDCRTQQQQMPNYKDVDHQRTKALREVTVQRTEKRLVHLLFTSKNSLYFI